MRLLFAIVLIFALKGQALVCSHAAPKIEDVASYMTSMADALIVVKLPFIKMKKVMAKQSSDLVDAMVALKEVKEGYECASEMMAPYKASKVEYISESAGTLAIAYKVLANGVEGSISDLKNDADGTSKNSVGSSAERSANKMLEVKKNWELVIMAIGVGTAAAVGKENPKTKRMDSLVITKAEKNKIIKILKSGFSDLGNKKDNDPIDAAANIYFGFFQQGWMLKSE